MLVFIACQNLPYLEGNVLGDLQNRFNVFNRLDQFIKFLKSKGKTNTFRTHDCVSGKIWNATRFSSIIGRGVLFKRSVQLFFKCWWVCGVFRCMAWGIWKRIYDRVFLKMIQWKIAISFLLLTLFLLLT